MRPDHVRQAGAPQEPVERRLVEHVARAPLQIGSEAVLVRQRRHFPPVTPVLAVMLSRVRPTLRRLSRWQGQVNKYDSYALIFFLSV